MIRGKSFPFSSELTPTNRRSFSRKYGNMTIGSVGRCRLGTQGDVYEHPAKCLRDWYLTGVLSSKSAELNTVGDYRQRPSSFLGRVNRRRALVGCCRSSAAGLRAGALRGTSTLDRSHDALSRPLAAANQRLAGRLHVDHCGRPQQLRHCRTPRRTVLRRHTPRSPSCQILRN